MDLDHALRRVGVTFTHAFEVFILLLVSAGRRFCLRGGGGKRGEYSVHLGDVSLHRARLWL